MVYVLLAVLNNLLPTDYRLIKIKAMKLFNTFTFSTLYTVLGVAMLTFLASCGADKDYTGVIDSLKQKITMAI